MMTTQQDSTRTKIPAQPDRRTARAGVVPDPGPEALHGRPRSVEGEEAYLRSVMEQAATDIAAGW